MKTKYNPQSTLIETLICPKCKHINIIAISAEANLKRHHRCAHCYYFLNASWEEAERLFTREILFQDQLRLLSGMRRWLEEQK